MYSSMILPSHGDERMVNEAQAVVAVAEASPAKAAARTGRSADGKELPAVGGALECVAAAADELIAGAGDEVADRASHEQLARAGQRGDAGGDMDADPRDVIT